MLLRIKRWEIQKWRWATAIITNGLILWEVYTATEMYRSQVRWIRAIPWRQKLIGRPLLKDKKLVHLSVAPRFSSGRETITFNAGIPTDLLTKDDNSYVEAKVDQVMINQWKLDLEMILLYNKWYFRGNIFLAHPECFRPIITMAKGWYGQIGYMILGSKA